VILRWLENLKRQAYDSAQCFALRKNIDTQTPGPGQLDGGRDLSHRHSWNGIKRQPGCAQGHQKIEGAAGLRCCPRAKLISRVRALTAKMPG